jgi:hypothetical protein
MAIRLRRRGFILTLGGAVVAGVANRLRAATRPAKADRLTSATLPSLRRVRRLIDFRGARTGYIGSPAAWHNQI